MDCSVLNPMEFQLCGHVFCYVLFIAQSSKPILESRIHNFKRLAWVKTLVPYSSRQASAHPQTSYLVVSSGLSPGAKNPHPSPIDPHRPAVFTEKHAVFFFGVPKRTRESLNIMGLQ